MTSDRLFLKLFLLYIYYYYYYIIIFKKDVTLSLPKKKLYIVNS